MKNSLNDNVLFIPGVAMFSIQNGFTNLKELSTVSSHAKLLISIPFP